LLLLLAACGEQALQQPNARPTNSEVSFLVTLNGRTHEPGRTNAYTGKFIRRHANGNRAEEMFYTAGRLEGVMTTWHSNGQLRSKLSYKNGAGEGLEEVWHSTGQMAAQSHYHAGLLHGATTTWYSNGVGRSRTMFKNGIKDGPEQTWHENGRPSRSAEWRDGRLNGLLVESYPNGNMLSSATYRLGKKSGTLRGWNSDGKPTTEEVYTNDQLISRTVWLPDGSRQIVSAQKSAKSRPWNADALKSYYLGQTDALVVETFGMPDSVSNGWWLYTKMTIAGLPASTNPLTADLPPTLRLQFKQGRVAQVDFSR